MFKRILILLCLLLFVAPSALAKNMLPDAILAALAPDLSLLDGGRIESFCFPSEGECIILLRDGKDELSLFSCVRSEEQWMLNWVNRYFSLVTEHPVTLSTHGEDITTRRTGTMYPTGFSLTVNSKADGTPLDTFDFIFIDGRWRLVQHAGSDGVYSEILHDAGSESCAVFWSDQRWTDTAGKIAFLHFTSSCADTMAISVLPSIYAGTYFFDHAPRFSTPQTELISVCLGVNGLKHPVYTGPGMNYHRAADGKAAVSSSESFGVLGKTGDWLMVIYGISDNRVRVGYVRCTDDPYLERIAELTFEPSFTQIRNVFTIKKLPLWDDPVNRTNPLCTLAKNTEVIYLERCGDLAYVEVRVNGRRMRGYVEDDSLGNG